MNSFGEVNKKFSLNAWDQRGFFLVLIFPLYGAVKQILPRHKVCCLHRSAPLILFTYGTLIISR